MTDMDDYIFALPEDRREPMMKLVETIDANLPEGFERDARKDTPAWVVPLSTYPAGYRGDPSVPLPFIDLASQSGHIAMYHMGMYVDDDLATWFKQAWPDHVPTKLSMGKSCVRLKKMSTIPYDLIAELCARMSADEWVSAYSS